MQPNSRTPLRPHGLRPVGLPTPINVRADPSGAPRSIARRSGRGWGLAHAVDRVDERWRIVDEWWRETGIARSYYRVVLEDGRMLTLFHDDAHDGWFLQRY